MPLRRPKLGAVIDKRLNVKSLPQVLRQAVRVFDQQQGDFDFYDEVERFVGESTDAKADKIRINPKGSPFFAKGDGVADDSEAMQAAMNYASSINADLDVPVGRYRLHHIEHKSNVRIYGAGMGATVFVARGLETYYVLGCNVTVTNLPLEQNTHDIGLFDLTVEGLTEQSLWDEQHHNLWYCGFTSFDIDRVQSNKPRGDSLCINTGNDPNAKKRNFNLRLGYFEANGGVMTVDGNGLPTKGGNRNIITVGEGENIDIRHIKADNFGSPTMPGGADFECENSALAHSHLSVRNISIGKIEITNGRGNHGAVSLVSYAPNSSIDRPIRGLTVAEIYMRDCPKMYAFVIAGAEVSRSESAKWGVRIGKVDAGNVGNMGTVYGAYGIDLQGIRTMGGVSKGALALGLTRVVGDVSLSDCDLPATTVNGYCLAVGSVDGLVTRNVTLTATDAAISLQAGTSTGLDFSGVRVLGAGTKAVSALAGHVQDPATNRAPLSGWGTRTSGLQTAPLAATLAPSGGVLGALTLTTTSSNGVSASQRLSGNFTPAAAGAYNFTLTPPAGYVVTNATGSLVDNSSGAVFPLGLMYNGKLTFNAVNANVLILALQVALLKV